MTISRKAAAALIAAFFVAFTAVSIRAQDLSPEVIDLVTAAYGTPLDASYLLASTQSIGSFPTFTGGFEDETVGTPATVSTIPSSTQQTAWTFQNGSGTGTIAATGGRSGPQYLSGFGATTARRFQSPTAGNHAVVTATDYIIQFYYRSSAIPANFGVQVGTDGTAGGTTTQPVTLANTAGTWTKIAQPLISNSAPPSNPGYGIITLRYSTTSSTTADFDDVVMYPGTAADTTAPGAPTSAAISSPTLSTLSVGWTAPAGGVDGGGYMVVRGTSDPATAPNVNGIYKVGNTVASGQTVVYIGTGSSFTDSGLTSGTQYFYRVYTVDKAFNYSTAATANGSTTSSYTLTYSAGTGGSITGTSPQTVVQGGSGSAVTAVPNSGYHFVNWSDGSTQNPRTDSNVTGNISVTANFVVNSFTLTYTAGANGSITGNSPQTVNSGSSGSSVTAVPNTGYSFVNWSDSSTANPRTDSNVTSNISVTANFADQTAPDTTILTHPANSTNSSSAAFTFSGVDSGSGVSSFECAMDTSTFTSCSSGSSYAGLADGSHSFSVRAKDTAGNIDPTPATYAWTVDTVGPVIQDYVPVLSTTSNSAQSLTVIATDSGGTGIAAIKVWFSANGGPLTSIDCAVSGSDNCSIPGQADGTAVAYYIDATDNAGNAMQMPNVPAPNLYTVGPGGAAIPAGMYSNANLPDGSSLAGDVTITGEFRLSGHVTTGSHVLELGCSAYMTLPAGSNYVIGSVKKDFCSAGSFTFVVGTAPASPIASRANASQSVDEYSPVSVNVLAVNGPSSLTVTATDAFLSGLTNSTAVSRYWTLTENGDLTADLTFTYLDEDINGDENGYQIFRRENGVDTPMGGTATPASNTVSIDGVSSFSQWGIGTTLAPTAGPVSLSGRVVTATGQGIRNATVSVSGKGSAARINAITGPFGYYQFDGLAAGETYVVTVNSKSFTFAEPSRIVTMNDSVSDLVFAANP